MDGSVAYAGATPEQLQESESFVAVVEGVITSTEYTTSDLAGGEDDAWALVFPETVATVVVERSSVDVGDTVTVVMSGAYLPADMEIAGLSPTGIDADPNALVEYLGLTGESPPIEGTRTVLFLQRASGDRAALGEYAVLGSGYGTYYWDQTTGSYRAPESRALDGRELGNDFLELSWG